MADELFNSAGYKSFVLLHGQFLNIQRCHDELPNYYVDDHPLFRGALRQTLNDSMESVTVFEAGSLDELVKALDGQDDTDLILLDLSMPGVKGFSG